MRRKQPWQSALSAVWALIGAAVIVFVFFALISGVAPSSAKVAMLVVVVLALLWIAHAVPRLMSRDTTHIDPADRERRGF